MTRGLGNLPPERYLQRRAGGYTGGTRGTLRSERPYPPIRAMSHETVYDESDNWSEWITSDPEIWHAEQTLALRRSDSRDTVEGVEAFDQAQADANWEAAQNGAADSVEAIGVAEVNSVSVGSDSDWGIISGDTTYTSHFDEGFARLDWDRAEVLAYRNTFPNELLALTEDVDYAEIPSAPGEYVEYEDTTSSISAVGYFRARTLAHVNGADNSFTVKLWAQPDVIADIPDWRMPGGTLIGDIDVPAYGAFATDDHEDAAFPYATYMVDDSLSLLVTTSQHEDASPPSNPSAVAMADRVRVAFTAYWYVQLPRWRYWRPNP